jgi:serine/threonine-protein kinase
MADIEKLGRYEIRRELGRGAMGVVYEAYDPMIKRVVALKTIRADRLEPGEAAGIVARFRREAEAAGRLHHPNIVSIFDFGEDEGTSYIAMEFVDGRDLKSRFDAGERFATADAIRLTVQILDALQYSHEHGVVHRDIKPANVFVKDDGMVKVADFGIAHLESSSLTQAGSVMGTPSSMSPEQVLGLPVDARTDVFSTGVILYQFVTGERPFGGAQSTTTMQKVLKEDPLPPTTLNVQLPDLMDEILRKALAKKPEERYASAAEFAVALRALAMPAPARATRATATAAPAYDGEATVVASTVLRPPAEKTASAAAPAPAYAPRPAPPVAAATAGATSMRPRSQLPAVMIVVGIVALALAAGLWWWMQSLASQAGRRVSADGTEVAATKAPQATMAPAPAPGSIPATAAVAAAPPIEPGTMLIAAAGFADANDPRYKGDPVKLAGALRADARGQLVEKALGLLVERKSLAANYEALNARLVANSGDFIRTVVRESEPVVGASGVATLTTEGVVNVKAMQKSLNEMTRAERLDVIRASGDPRVSVAIAVRDAERPDLPPQRSAVAENLLAERIRSFGFRVVSDGTADVSIAGEAAVKRLSTRLEASGIVVTKFALSSWTLKAVDRTTGEEIYHATALPKGPGSWASEEEALKAIGGGVADAFSREFFLQHANAAAKRATLQIDGLPSAAVAAQLAREFVGLPAVIAARPRAGAAPGTWELDLAGDGPVADLVAAGVLAPINAKLGRPCLIPGATAGEEVRVRFDAGCNDPAVLGRLETNPPAGLYGAPESRQRSVLRDPDALKKLSI